VSRVVVRSTITGKELWAHPLTGRPFIEYVPAEAFQLEEIGEAVIDVEETE